MDKSRLHKFKPGYSWSGVEKEPYKAADTGGREGCFCGASRQTLVGLKDENVKFHLRYFEIAPGGNSSLEKHVHEHAVICVRGRGQAVVDDRMHELSNLDVLYIAPDTPHQLLNPYTEPFGFLCIVDAERDRPRKLSPDELKRLDESEETKGKYIGYIEGD